MVALALGRAPLHVGAKAFLRLAIDGASFEGVLMLAPLASGLVEFADRDQRAARYTRRIVARRRSCRLRHVDDMRRVRAISIGATLPTIFGPAAVRQAETRRYGRENIRRRIGRRAICQRRATASTHPARAYRHAPKSNSGRWRKGDSPLSRTGARQFSIGSA